MDRRPDPIVVDLGKRKRKHLEQLVQGEGPAATEVSEAMAQVRMQLGDEADGKVLVPVVVVYGKKARKGLFLY